ncbi:hypothetical protein SH2C18_16060 [Clostridium sediminicola]|uniref:dethiobiotin synthase n=1 Tax=Clostridium sediminicola TaxID=3114879 RepID=UPI0031F1E65B
MIRFIVGTGTGVGKTHYGKSLIEKGHRVIKPIETGKNTFKNINDSDCYTYANMQKISVDKVNKYFFTKAVSPHLASEIDGIDFDINSLKEFVNCNKDVFVELAGGLFVPIKRGYTQLDFIKSFDNASVHLVIENKLGCINHALLTIDVLKRNNIEIEHLHFNQIIKDDLDIANDNIRVIKDFC